MATTIQDLEERVDALYNSILQMQLNLNPVIDKSDDADNKINNTIPQVNKNTSDISDTTNGLVDLADITDDNVTGLTDLADIIAELDERVTALEEK